MIVVVMGVTGAGKTTVGRLLAERLGVRYADADDFHTSASIARMAAGRQLNDVDRLPWLESTASWMRGADASHGGAVVSCSALKRGYREVLRKSDAQIVFVHLTGDPALIAERVAGRVGHFMPPSLIDSQYRDLEPLEPDESGFVVDTSVTPGEIVDQIQGWLQTIESPG